MRSIMMSWPRWRLASAAASTRPSGEFFSSASMTLGFTWLRSARSETFLMRSCGSTRLRCRVQSLSRRMPTAATQHLETRTRYIARRRSLLFNKPFSSLRAPRDYTGARLKASLDAPPDERIARRCGAGQCPDAFRPEGDFDGAVALRIENLRARAAPAFQGAGPSVAVCDPAGGDHQSRSALFYPLGAGALGAGLPSEDDRVA